MVPGKLLFPVELWIFVVQCAVINKALLKQRYKADYYFLKSDRDTQESP